MSVQTLQSLVADRRASYERAETERLAAEAARKVRESRAALEILGTLRPLLETAVTAYNQAAGSRFKYRLGLLKVLPDGEVSVEIEPYAEGIRHVMLKFNYEASMEADTFRCFVLERIGCEGLKLHVYVNKRHVDYGDPDDD